MNKDTCKKILIVGNQASIRKAGIHTDKGQKVELVSTLAEAVAKQASEKYARVIVDPDALDPSVYEILTRPLLEIDGISNATESDASALFKAIFENTLSGIGIVDNEGRFVDANPAVVRILGTERDSIIGKSWFSYVSPEIDISTIWTALIRDKRWMGEIRLIRSDGTVRDTQSYAVADILPGFSVFVFRDVTEQHHTEDSLVESRAREQAKTIEMRAILDAAPVLIWIANDPECRVVTGNKAASELLNMPPDTNQIIGCGTNTSYFVQKKDGHKLQQDELPIRQAILTGSIIRNYEMDLEFEDGSVRRVVGNAAPLKDASGKIRGAVAAFRDVTYRRLIEEELARAKQEAEQQAAMMQSFVSSIAEGVSIFDNEGNVIFMNEAGRSILGIPTDEALDDWIHRYQYYTLDNEPMDVKESASYRALHGEVVKDLRYIVETPWGRKVTVSVSSAPVRLGEDKIYGITSIFRDISSWVEFGKRQGELLERERRIADTLQRSLIPPTVPRSAGNYRFATLYQPALREAEVGGDFYDIFELGPNLLGILIADVAGKGLNAAITVASARFTIRSYAYLDPVPAKVMTLANETLSRTASDELPMLTAFFAILDLRTGEMSYSNAGHEPPLVCSCNGDIRELYTEGRSLGVMGDFIYTQARFHFKPGDRVVMFTDGITEARHNGAFLFGQEGIADYLKQNCSLDIDSIASGLYETAKQHAQGRLQDDAAIIVIEAVPQ
jgi:PAS domain S-box-containing protein